VSVTGSVIVACEMIEDEVRLALQALDPDDRPPIVWVESGLHDRPTRLREVLGEIVRLIDEGARTGRAATIPSVRPGPGPAAGRRSETVVGPVDTVLFAFGFCGNALNGLSADNLTMVIPRADDCVALLLNHGCVREEIPRDARHYYLTRGWFNHESSLTEAFMDWNERFGEERAAKLRKTMFSGYECVDLIDTRAYDTSECLAQSQDVASELGLEHGIVQGSVQLLERLFKGERDSEIIAIPPSEEIGFDHLFNCPLLTTEEA